MMNTVYTILGAVAFWAIALFLLVYIFDWFVIQWNTYKAWFWIYQAWETWSAYRKWRVKDIDFKGPMNWAMVERLQKHKFPGHIFAGFWKRLISDMLQSESYKSYKNL